MLAQASCNPGGDPISDAKAEIGPRPLATEAVVKQSTAISEISSKSGWGGARANSGGARANSGGAREGAGRPAKRAIEYLPLGPRWYVLQVYAGAERRVVQDLLEGETRRGYPARQAFTVYRPTTSVLRRNRLGLWVTSQVAMFSGYVFVHFDRLTDPWRTINRETCDGVIKLMMTRGELPIPLPSDFVQKLKDKEVERLKLPEERLEVFAKGSDLIVEDGPFARYRAVCKECDGYTTTAIVTIFGRDTPVTAPRAWFRAAEG